MHKTVLQTAFDLDFVPNFADYKDWLKDPTNSCVESVLPDDAIESIKLQKE